MLSDLLKDLERVKPASIRKLFEEMVSQWFDEHGTLEQRNEIIRFALDNNLGFMVPSDWYADYSEPIRKAQGSEDDKNEEEAAKQKEQEIQSQENNEGEKSSTEDEPIDHKNTVLSITSSKDTAAFFKDVIDQIKSIQNNKAKSVTIKFAADDEDLKTSFTLDMEDFKLDEVQERYVGQEEENKQIVKARVTVSFTEEGSAQNLEDLISSLKGHEQLIIDPDNDDSRFDLTSIKSLEYAIDGTSASIITNDAPKVKAILDAVAACGNGGHSFSLVVDGKKVSYWDGDGQDYIKEVELNKAEDKVQKFFSNSFIFDSSYSPVRYQIQELQQALIPYGVIVNYVDKCLVRLDFESELLPIVGDKLDTFGLVQNEVETTVNKLGIVSLYLDLNSLLLEKARKGTAAYDEWYRKYKEKRIKANKSEGTVVGNQGKVSPDEWNEMVKHLLSDRDLVADLNFHSRRAENELELERMFSGPRRDSKGRYSKE